MNEYIEKQDTDNFDEFKGVNGVYIIYTDAEKPYIGQSLDLKNRLTQHHQNYPIYKYKILETINTDVVLGSKYLLSTCLVYLADKYIQQYGIDNLENKVLSFKNCCDLNSQTTLYNFDTCTKEITYNLCMELIKCDYNFEKFFIENQDFKIYNMLKYPYYKLAMKERALRTNISEYLGFTKAYTYDDEKIIDDIIKHINRFRGDLNSDNTTDWS